MGYDLSDEGGCEENMRRTMHVDTTLLVMHVLKRAIVLTNTAHTLYIRPCGNPLGQINIGPLSTLLTRKEGETRAEISLSGLSIESSAPDDDKNRTSTTVCF